MFLIRLLRLVIDSWWLQFINNWCTWWCHLDVLCSISSPVKFSKIHLFLYPFVFLSSSIFFSSSSSFLILFQLLALSRHQRYVNVYIDIRILTMYFYIVHILCLYIYVIIIPYTDSKYAHRLYVNVDTSLRVTGLGLCTGTSNWNWVQIFMCLYL